MENRTSTQNSMLLCPKCGGFAIAIAIDFDDYVILWACTDCSHQGGVGDFIEITAQ